MHSKSRKGHAGFTIGREEHGDALGMVGQYAYYMANSLPKKSAQLDKVEKYAQIWCCKVYSSSENNMKLHYCPVKIASTHDNLLF